MTKRTIMRFGEFLIIGVLMGVVEDLLAILFATEAKINFKVFWVVLIVAIPFAFISEIIVDHPFFWKKKILKKKTVR